MDVRAKIQHLIDTGIAPTVLAKETNIPVATCYRILNGEASLDNLTLKNIEKLLKYHDKYFLNK